MSIKQTTYKAWYVNITLREPEQVDVIDDGTPLVFISPHDQLVKREVIFKKYDAAQTYRKEQYKARATEKKDMAEKLERLSSPEAAEAMREAATEQEWIANVLEQQGY